MASHASFKFSKMHGAGNDFVVLDLRADAALARRLSENAADLCRALADRHTGVGCDQILTIEPPRDADAVASYRIWNNDGSPSRQCGNGARCLAAWLVRDGSAGRHGFNLESPSGMHAVQSMGDDHYQIAMGAAQFTPQAIPLRGFVDAQDEYEIDIDGEPVRFGAVSMGNPHAVIEVLDLDTAAVDLIGPRVQQDAAFPESANVGFAEVVSRDRIKLRVYERGVGETLACGSGACAAVAVLSRRGRIDGAEGVLVSLPGGQLHIHYDPKTGMAMMAGPAAFVFEGEWLQ
ncbi:MAG: diaminopimelate epimerase [Pseudomonadota bacterium]|nr:diaminopimelate epimerase [Pseudomonadota bacterium]